MTVNRFALEMFLSTYTKDQNAVKLAMKELEPFFLITEKGEYPLASASEELRAEAVEAIAKALHIPAPPKVVFVSLANPFPKQEWISKEVYDANLFSSCECNLADSLWESHGASLCETFGKTNLWDSLRACLGDSFLSRSLWNSLGDSTLWSSLTYSIEYYLGFTIVGDREKMDQLTPLIRLLPRAIPMSQKTDELGTWFVRVA